MIAYSHLIAFLTRLHLFHSGTSFALYTAVLSVSLATAACGASRKPPTMFATQDRVVLAATKNVPVTVINSDNGSLARKIPETDSTNPIFAAYANMLYQIADEQTLMAVDMSNDTPPFKLWKAPSGTVQIVAADEYRVYLTNSDNTLWGINRSTGTADWQVDLALSLPVFASVWKDSFFLSDRNGIRKVDSRSGRILWSQSLPDGLGPSQLSENTIYVANSKGVIWGLDSTSGKTVWNYDMQGKACLKLDPMVFVTSGYVIGCFKNKTRGIDVKTRNPRWFSPGHALGMSGDMIVLRLDATTLAGFHARTTEIKWTQKLSASLIPQVSIQGEQLFVRDKKNTIYNINIQTGSIRWRYSQIGM